MKALNYLIGIALIGFLATSCETEDNYIGYDRDFSISIEYATDSSYAKVFYDKNSEIVGDIQVDWVIEGNYNGGVSHGEYVIEENGIYLIACIHVINEAMSVDSKGFVIDKIVDIK